MTSVLIVGCGVFGLSTALELSKNGYKVTAIDKYPVPSPWSAACDYNKIIRTEYNEICYTKMSVEALEMWRNDPLYKDVYNECGRILITPPSAAKRNEFELQSIECLKSIGQGSKIELFKGSKVLGEKFKELEFNSIEDDILIKFNPEGGLGHAANSLKVVFNECVTNGVNFRFGPKGSAVEIKVINGIEYVITKDGSKYTADQIIISSGASTGKLLDLKTQQSATGLFVSHIRLTQDEFEKYKKMPIVFDSVQGYFFPPDPETNIMKIALPGSGASNLKDGVSLPRYKLQNPEDTMPKECVKIVKTLLSKYVPDLAYHKLFNHKACWVADTADSHFIIDQVPYYKKVYVASGDSGHGFKLLPNIGKYIRQRLEKTLSSDLSTYWRWREDAKAFDASECDWRVVTENLDFSQIDWFVDESPKL